MTTKKNSKRKTKKPATKKSAAAKSTKKASIKKKPAAKKAAAKKSSSRTRQSPAKKATMATSKLLDTARARLSNAGELIANGIETARQRIMAAESDLESSLKNSSLDVSKAAESVRQIATDLISGKTPKGRT